MKTILILARGFGVKAIHAWNSVLEDRLGERVKVITSDPDQIADALVFVTVPDSIECLSGSGYPNRILYEVDEAISTYKALGKDVFFLKLNFTTPKELTPDFPVFEVMTKAKSDDLENAINVYIARDPVSSIK